MISQLQVSFQDFFLADQLTSQVSTETSALNALNHLTSTATLIMSIPHCLNTGASP
jgi:hypothetical protein